jgi:hypothetical protein
VEMKENGNTPWLMIRIKEPVQKHSLQKKQKKNIECSVDNITSLRETYKSSRIAEQTKQKIIKTVAKPKGRALWPVLQV